jgi:tRNA threonylcarbamoyladenosine biosynthesis protein TsaE
MELIYSLEEINAISNKILEQNPKKVVIFNANMGVGKTTFIKSLLKNLGVIDTISSPTFSLINEYKTIDNQIVYHFDFYRLKSENEAYDFGVEEYLYSNHWCFIEWAEKIPNLLPQDYSIIDLELLDNGKRKLVLTI